MIWPLLEGHLHVAVGHIPKLRDEIALLVDFLHRVDALSAGLQELLIGNAGGLHNALLEINSMSLRNQSSNIVGNEATANTGFMVLQLMRNTKDHYSTLLLQKYVGKFQVTLDGSRLQTSTYMRPSRIYHFSISLSSVFIKKNYKVTKKEIRRLLWASKFYF